MTAPRHFPLPYAAGFAAVKATLPGAEVGWLADLRTDALGRLVESGFPSRRVEAWRYTDLQPLADTALATAGPKDAGAAVDAASLPSIEGAHRLVFVNGRFNAGLSDSGPAPDGLEVSTLAEAAANGGIEGRVGALAGPNGHAVVNVNTAFMTDGCVLNVRAGARVEVPLHLVFVATPAANGSPALAHHPRNLIVVGKDSRAALIESHVGADADAVYWSNPVTEITIEPGARLDHVKVQADSPAATHLSFTRARLAESSRYESFVLTIGAALSRNEIEVVLDGENGVCRLNGSYLVRGTQHADTTTFLHHAVSNCDTDEVYKGVLDDTAHGVFQGKILVAPDAQKTNGNQLSRAILLSDGAEVTTKPELEIYADDVKCSHGATTGELDEEALFYLRARGIPTEVARRMLVRAFVGELIEGIEVDGVHAHLEGLVDGWLAAGASAAAGDSA